MDNKQFPGEEEQDLIPVELFPDQPENTTDESLPQFAELPIVEELAAVEIPLEELDVMPEMAAEEIPLEEMEEIPAQEISLFEEPANPEAIPVALPEISDEESDTLLSLEVPAAVPEINSETAEAVPLPEAEALAEPEISLEISPDDHAMDAQGLLEHGEEEPPFDLSILDDPELDVAVEDVDITLLQPEEKDLEYQDNSQDFDTIFNAPAPEEKKPTTVHPARKGRPKRKKGEGLLGIPNILVTFVWLALILAIGVTAGRMLWICAADVLAFGREDKAVTITIYEADTMEDIVDKLHANGLIRYKSLFNLYASISDAEEDIQPGIYDLNTRYDYHALVNFMSPRSSREVVEALLIPEGYTCQQIFDLLEEKRVCTAVDIAAYAANGELKDYWFLEGVERGSEYCLEGFLFPDTYDFYKNSSPREALEKLLDGFEYRFSEEMRAQIDTLNANVTGGGYTVREVAIVASLIEKESASPEESPKVSGVIYNRLFNWGTNPPYLNIDAAIVYALGGKSDLTREDLQIDSPYNTYTYTGLTPTPIANPGLSSLKAALNPESHNYYYYVLNPATGTHQFSTTYEEHSGYVRKFAEGS